MDALARENFNPHMSEADLAHAILKNHGSPLNFGELFEKFISVKPLIGKDRAHIMAGIHTELNLDGRFIHIGKGIWGLREWIPGRRVIIHDSDDELDQ